MRNANRLFIFLLGAAWLFSCCGAANAVTPMVAMGGSYSIGLHADGTLRAWGDDSAGQLGLGRVLRSTTPIATAGLTGVIAIAAGAFHTVALKADGSVWAWGLNTNGQLGDGGTMSRATPVVVPGLTGVIAIAAGRRYTVALKADGSVWAWGKNTGGQLGDGSFVDRATPAAVPGLTGVTAIAAGNDSTVALKTDGSVWAWGLNNLGQLGNGSTTETFPFGSATPAAVPGLTGVTAIAVGGNFFTVALKADGSVWVWGGNGIGQLGDGGTMNHATPVVVPGLTGVTAIAAGGASTIALKTDGSVWAWGSNGSGQLGDGSFVDRATPAAVPGLTGVTAIAAGDSCTVALKTDGSVWAWGSNYYGQLGNGSFVRRAIPAAVPGLTGVTAIAAGESHTVVLKTDGSVWAWGNNGSGQLGDGGTMNHATPVVVPGLTGVTAIAAGVNFTVALKADGSVWAWGNNNSGQLGDGGTMNHATPVVVPGLTGVIAIAAGASHTVALKTDGSVWAWGFNQYGQLGDGGTMNHATPVVVPGLTGVTAIAAGNDSTVALKTDGSVWAWGDNYFGQLGDGSTTSRATPAAVPGLTGVIAIAVGEFHTVVLKTDGSVWAWGWNNLGQLGDGSFVDRATPSAVLGLTGVTAIAAGASHTVTLKTDGSVWAWGWNYYGQLGDGSTMATPQYGSATPVVVPGLTGVTAIAAGGWSTIALKADGSVAAWGYNTSGELGDGTFAQRHFPVLAVNPSVDGFLNLNTDTTVNVPPELNVPFFVSSSGGITDASASVSTSTKFNTADVGKSGAVFVTAMVPSGSLGVMQQAMSVNKALRSMALAASDTSSFVLMQLTPSGWQPVVNGQLIPYASGVLGDQLADQSILNGTDTTNLKGAEFCLGYGTSADQMIAAGTIRAVATIPDPSATGMTTVTCLPPNHSDSWWNTNESGWGVTLTDHGRNAFVQWYTYDESGHNQKYVISGGTFSNNKCQFSGDIQHVTGPSWTLPTFDPNLVIRTTAGSGSFDFCPPDLPAGTIVFKYTADGITGSKQLTRLPFGNDVPHRGGSTNTGASDFTDLWWNPAESGWGVSVTQHGDNIFFRVFTYDTDNRPLLFVVAGGTFNDGATSFTGNLVLTSGPWFGTAPFDPNQVVRTTAGTATLTFTDANNGVLSYTVNGVTVTKTITRMVF